MAASREPPRHPGPLDLAAVRADPLAFLTESVARYGEVFRYRLGGLEAVALAHPDALRHVLAINPDNYCKLGTPDLMLLRPMLGDGLMTADGEPWQRQRRLLMPAFSRRYLEHYVAAMAAETESLLSRWEACAGGTVDLVPELGGLALRIVARCLFATDLGCDVAAFSAAFAEMSDSLAHFDPSDGSAIPRFRRAASSLDGVVLRLIAAGRVRGGDDSDLLALLLTVRDAETGAPLDDRRLRDQIVTFLVGGGETTGQAVGWTLYLLDCHPEVRERVAEEAAMVLGAAAVDLGSIGRLEQTWMAIQESMRLYPPVWLMSRVAQAEDVVAGWRVDGGSLVVMSPFMVHRHPAFWDEPERFRPERFKPGAIDEQTRRAFLAFSDGPRLCIGKAFATLETKLVVASILLRFRPRLLPGHPVEPEGTVVTLRPRHGLPVVLEPR
ncbi:MAG TPA: cytochrome P450 [Thermoanaerobaculia bacterium]|nr:cytochrome P450 [Thermoanaerobaculia bacterium]